MNNTVVFRVFKMLMAVIVLVTSTGQASAAQPSTSRSQAEVSRTSSSAVRAASAQLQQEVSLLYLNRFQFDPLQSEPEIPPEQLTSYAPGQEGFYLVQFFDAPEDQWLDELRAAGVVIIQFQASHAYIVRMTPEEAAVIDQLEFVRWTGVYHAAYRIAQSVLQPPEQFVQEGIILNVEVTIYDDGQVVETTTVIKELGGELLEQYPARSDGSLVTTIYALPLQAVESVAQLNAVLWMNFRPPVDEPEDEMSNQIIAGNISPLVTGYQAWLTANGVNGSGVTVALVDTGYDTGNNLTAHPDLRGRLIPVGIPIDTDGHGTHVGGIIAGNASLATSDGSGFRFGLGVAPNSNLVAMLFTGADPNRTRNAVINGAVASNNSYALSAPASGYTARDNTYDSLVRDADQTTATVAEPLVIVFSTGNSGALGPTKEAKNIIAVGNSLNQRDSAGLPVPGTGSIDTLRSTSSRGPAQDNRIYPHVTAPGTSIISTRSTQAGLVSCAVVAAGAPTANPTYSMCTGTSMAAPHVTGSVALITQWWRGFNAGANPSPAMVKTLLINGAVDMGVADIPNNNEGWGRINLDNVINPPVPVIYQDQTTTFTAKNQTWSLSVGPADPTQPLKVSLVWSDAPGPGSGTLSRALVNNLDLTLAQGTTTFLGNVFASGFSTTGGAADQLNNAENVYIQSPSGVYTITVNATEIAGDGVPLNGDSTDQDFALVCTNCVLPADLALTKSDSPDPVTPGGTLTYTLTATNNGPNSATNVVVTDTLPAGVTLVSATSSQGSCSGTVTCNLGDLASGANATVTITVIVDAATACGTTLTNSASLVSDLTDPNAGNNTASADTLVDCPADLSITKSAAPNPVTAGNDLTFTLTVTNNGPNGATGVTVTDTLPVGVTLVSATSSQGSCSGAVTCILGNLASGSSATIIIIVTVDPASASGTIVNTASVTGTGSDPDPANNTANADTQVLALCTILDDFNQPDGPLGSNWDGRIRGYRIRDNQVVVRAGGPIYWQPASYGPDQEGCVTLTRINPRSRQHALLLKVQELNNWRKGAILVSYNARSGNVDVKARDVSARRWILVGSFLPATPVVDGDQLRARAFADGSVEVLINNVSLGTADAGSFYVDKGGQIGLWFRNPLGGDDDGDDEDDQDDKYIQEDLLYEKIAGRRAILDDFGGGTIAAP